MRSKFYKAIPSLLAVLFFALFLSSCLEPEAKDVSDAVWLEADTVVAFDDERDMAAAQNPSSLEQSFSKLSNPDGRTQSTVGRFYYAAELEDLEGNQKMLYQFCSDDNEIWWLLSAEEIGFVPVILDQDYMLVYDNNGTTQENKGCDCPPEYDCDCYCYDDVFIGLTPVGTARPSGF